MRFRTLGELTGRCPVDTGTSPKNKINGVFEPQAQPDGTAFLSIGEDLVSAALNRGVAAVANNTDVLFRLIHRAKISWRLYETSTPISGSTKVVLRDFGLQQHEYILANVSASGILPVDVYHRLLYSDAGNEINFSHFEWGGVNLPSITPSFSQQVDAEIVSWGLKIPLSFQALWNYFQPGLLVDVNNTASYNGTYMIVATDQASDHLKVVLSNRISDPTNIDYTSFFAEAPFFTQASATACTVQIRYDLFYPVSENGNDLAVVLSDTLSSAQPLFALLLPVLTLGEPSIQDRSLHVYKNVQKAPPTLDEIYKGKKSFNANLGVSSNLTIDDAPLHISTNAPLGYSMSLSGTGVAGTVSTPLVSLTAVEVFANITLTADANGYYFDVDPTQYSAVYYIWGYKDSLLPCEFSTRMPCFAKLDSGHLAVVDSVSFVGTLARVHLTFLGEAPSSNTATVVVYVPVTSLHSGDLHDLSFNNEFYFPVTLGEPRAVLWQDHLNNNKTAFVTIVPTPWYLDSDINSKLRHENRALLYIPIAEEDSTRHEHSFLLSPNRLEFLASGEHVASGKARILLAASNSRFSVSDYSTIAGVDSPVVTLAANKVLIAPLDVAGNLAGFMAVTSPNPTSYYLNFYESLASLPYAQIKSSLSTDGKWFHFGLDYVDAVLFRRDGGKTTIYVGRAGDSTSEIRANSDVLTVSAPNDINLSSSSTVNVVIDGDTLLSVFQNANRDTLLDIKGAAGSGAKLSLRPYDAAEGASLIRSDSGILRVSSPAAKIDLSDTSGIKLHALSSSSRNVEVSESDVRFGFPNLWLSGDANKKIDLGIAPHLVTSFDTSATQASGTLTPASFENLPLNSTSFITDGTWIVASTGSDIEPATNPVQNFSGLYMLSTLVSLQLGNSDTTNSATVNLYVDERDPSTSSDRAFAIHTINIGPNTSGYVWRVVLSILIDVPTGFRSYYIRIHNEGPANISYALLDSTSDPFPVDNSLRVKWVRVSYTEV